jgi:hypothetical protein
MRQGGAVMKRLLPTLVLFLLLGSIINVAVAWGWQFRDTEHAALSQGARSV